jgi:hypothetical protein
MRFLVVFFDFLISALSQDATCNRSAMEMCVIMSLLLSYGATLEIVERAQEWQKCRQYGPR